VEKVLDSVEKKKRDTELVISLEAEVERAKIMGADWLEVDEAVLRYFNKGNMPGAGYILYKGVKLCLAGAAEELARRDNLDVFNVVFKDEKMKVSTVKK